MVFGIKTFAQMSKASLSFIYPVNVVISLQRTLSWELCCRKTQFGHSALPLGFAFPCVKWRWQQRKSREEMEAGAGTETHAHLSRNPGCGLHLPGQATSGGNRLFFRHICIFSGFTSTKDSLSLLQWPREGSINQQLVKVEACGGEETQK